MFAFRNEVPEVPSGVGESATATSPADPERALAAT
jgi:hypothetical protein